MHASIEAGLRRPWYRLRLPPALEAQYRAETLHGSGFTVQTWLAVFALFNVLSLVMDHDVFGPAAFHVPLALTLGVFCPVALLAILSLRGRPTMLRMTLAASATGLVDTAIVLNSARLAPPAHTDTYILLAAIVPLVVGLIAPLPFRHVVGYCSASLALYAGLILAFGLAGPGETGVPLLVSGLIIVPLKLGYSREWEAKKIFLLGLREKLQAEALALANARLTILSETDSMTGLANRRHFSACIERAWKASAEEGEWLGVLLLDIDHFKLFNDTAGHPAGDSCLIAVAGALGAAVEARGGFAARYGGEEFVAFLPGTDLSGAIEAGEAIRAAVARLALPHPGLSKGAMLAVSVGATAAYGATRAFGVTADDLLKAADLALYAAKAGGRDRVEALPPAANTNRPEDGAAAAEAP
ncbi:GGDEF domain-containing protein [Methylorubrum salsuginis]|uniref:diguanylate cyclase n=1 Tax=Methylorubrum salsuginis TaxID=414703 RepID=A0A1I4FSE5_9HYPH|nr:diguanylate cyclase [Methylorubrum salsuginis]SFL19907.1 diguanylate cyclase (GGDEF) domain-containing protein [Methylorubrum salsuginis]